MASLSMFTIAFVLAFSSIATGDHAVGSGGMLCVSKCDTCPVTCSESPPPPSQIYIIPDSPPPSQSQKYSPPPPPPAPKSSSSKSPPTNEEQSRGGLSYPYYYFYTASVSPLIVDFSLLIVGLVVCFSRLL